MLHRSCLLPSVATLFALGCSTTAQSPIRPTAPERNDERYAVSRVQSWYVIETPASAGQDRLEIEVVPPPGGGDIDLWLNDRPPLRMVATTGDNVGAIVDIGDLPVGEHELLLTADGSSVAFARITFNRSAPLFVVVSTDWDDSDNSDPTFVRQEELHQMHPELKLTHFVGPYTFTDPMVTAQRRSQAVSWLINMRDTYGDEIGLHIHPYCNFVETTDVECRHTPSYTQDDGDVTGYTVLSNAYTVEEYTALLEHAKVLFRDNGLGTPTSFRAGGWIADTTVLSALHATGFVADTSANNWARLEEWEGQLNGVLFDWNKENWSSMGDTSQPYFPSKTDPQRPGDAIGILEVPDNGSLVDYVTGQEMIDIFAANWAGQVLEQPIVYSIGYHPPNFSASYQTRMNVALRHVDQFLASSGRGPVIYSTLSDMAKVWVRD